MSGHGPRTVTKICTRGEISHTVVTAVAEAKGVDPLDLTPLTEVVDVDALDRMFRPTATSQPSSLELSFWMAGCDVVVRGDGEVVVTPAAAEATQAATATSTDD